MVVVIEEIESSDDEVDTNRGNGLLRFRKSVSQIHLPGFKNSILRKHVLHEGTGEAEVAREANSCGIHFVIRLDNEDGKIIQEGELQVSIGKKQLPVGWEEGVASMKLKELSVFQLSSDLAYGQRGNRAMGIPPDKDLNIQVELLSVEGNVMKRSMDGLNIEDTVTMVLYVLFALFCVYSAFWNV